MNTDKTLFVQIMEHVSWKTFGRIIERLSGDAGVRTLSCADVFRVMAFAQLTWRESLRDIEVCRASNQPKLFHMGLKSLPARSTLADALNPRDWRIYHALAMRLIARARERYVKEPMSVDLDATLYALDATTIELCLSVFDWAPFRLTKAAVKMHTLLGLRGAIAAFIHVSDGKLGGVNVRDILPVLGAFTQVGQVGREEIRIELTANLGHDADPTGAQAGQLVGAFYGESGISAEWLTKLTKLAKLAMMAMMAMMATIRDVVDALFEQNFQER